MSAKRFRTKIVEIEAIQWTGQNHGEVYDFSGGQFNSFPEDNEGFTGLIYDKLHDTWIKVVAGQWIVRGAKGEFYPCDDETFHWKYEEVAEAPPFQPDLDLIVSKHRDGEDMSHYYDEYYKEGHQ